jgi:hypothetical protein
MAPASVACVMALLRRGLTLSCAGLLLASCSSAPGDSETDRQAQTLADAISYPHQEDAAGFVRAAMATNLGKSGDFVVLEAKDLPHSAAEDPMAHMVWRIHRDAVDAGFNGTPAVDACYSVEFNYHGASSGPSRVDCPPNPVAITPSPLPRRDIPQDYAPALETTLGKMPATLTEGDVRAALTSGLPVPQVDIETGLTAVPPQVSVQVKGADVGVALFARTGVDSKDCMMGRRVDGTVRVWSLNWRDLGPLEKSCSAEAALAGG